MNIEIKIKNLKKKIPYFLKSQHMFFVLNYLVVTVCYVIHFLCIIHFPTLGVSLLLWRNTSKVYQILLYPPQRFSAPRFSAPRLALPHNYSQTTFPIFIISRSQIMVKTSILQNTRYLMNVCNHIRMWSQL